MDGLLVVLRLGLATAFAVAAWGKALDRTGFAATLRAFGVREAAVPAGSVAVPALEFAIAGGMLVPASAPAAAAVVVLLLVGFSAAIARLLARGDHPDCSCFGQFRSRPIGAGTLLRNAALVAAAAVVLFAS